MSAIFCILLLFLAVFLILLVLVQRGRGGGLTGALGGMGGSSAFGAKAGDMFTRITIVTAAIWITTCVAAAYWAANRGDALGKPDIGPGIPGPIDAAMPNNSSALPAALPVKPAEQPAAPAESAPPAADK
jgi:preprotein translocase subunit SecG